MANVNRVISLRLLGAQQRIADARTRAASETEQGEIVEKVIIVAAAALIAIAAMAAIAAAVDLKIGGTQPLIDMPMRRRPSLSFVDRAGCGARRRGREDGEVGSSTVEFVICSVVMVSLLLVDHAVRAVLPSSSRRHDRGPTWRRSGAGRRRFNERRNCRGERVPRPSRIEPREPVGRRHPLND